MHVWPFIPDNHVGEPRCKVETPCAHAALDQCPSRHRHHRPQSPCPVEPLSRARPELPARYPPIVQQRARRPGGFVRQSAGPHTCGVANSCGGVLSCRWPPACAARAARSSRRRTQRCSCVAAVASPVVCSCGRLASRTGRRRWRARREALSPTRHVGQPQLSSGLRRERPSAAPAPSLGPALHLLTWRSASVLGRAPQARQSPP